MTPRAHRLAIEPPIEAAAGGGEIPTAGAAWRLARAALGSFGLNVVNTILATLTTIVLARLLGVSDFGVYSFVVATVMLLGVPAILGIDRLLIRDVAVYVRQGADGLARGLVQRATQATLLASLGLALVAGLVAWLVAGGQLTPGLLAVWAGLAGLPFLALGRVAQGGLMGLHHVVLGQAPEYLLRPLLLLGGIALGYLWLGGRLDAPMAALLHTASYAGALALALLLLARRLPSGMRRARAAYDGRAWAASAALLALLSGTAVINSQTGVVLLGALADSESAGLYAVAQRGALLIAFPLAAVNAAIAPTAARLWSSADRAALQRLVTLSARGVLAGALPLALAFILLGRPILAAFFGEPFAAADAPLAVLSLGQLANAATGSVAVLLVMTGQQRLAALGTAAGALLNVIVALALIPVLGTVGAAVGAALSLTLSNGLMVIAARRRLGLDSTAAGLPPRPAAGQAA
ncbi:MAG TPA: polysaccharide biosynthesis C-terminal domain-containing protein [Candidatus Limnocylindrales bacterium]